MSVPVPVHVIYDGECPFCTAYVRMLRLKQAVGEVELLNARDPHPLVDALKDEGIDFDAGMVVKHGNTVHHGAAAVQWLSLMTTPSATFNGLMAGIMKDERRARLLYPALRAGRALALRFKGRQPIHRPEGQGTP